MLVIDPCRVVELDDETFESITAMQKNRMEMALKHVSMSLDSKTLAGAAMLVAENTGIQFQLFDIGAILALYPIERASLVEYGVSDTEAASGVMDSMANFFLGSRWPMYKDKIGVDDFVARLREAAKVMGYTVQQ